VPSTTSTTYAQPVHLTQNTVVSARAFAAGVGSTTTQANFTVNCTSSGPLTPPVIAPWGGVFTGSASVTLTAATGATIYYTLDGSTPGVTTAQYTAPILLTQSGWVRAIAVKAGSVSSSTAEASFTVIPSSTQPPAAPVIFPNGGTFTTCPAVTLSTTTVGASIFYTLDGSTPTMNSAAYSAAIQLTTSAVVRAAAFLSATSESTISQASFTVNCQPSPLPAQVVIAPGGGVFTGSVDITLSSTPGAVIYYTLDGSTPTAGTLVYGGPIHLTHSAWVRSSAIQGTYSTPAAEKYFTVN
jgi:hypothetical protein